MSHQMVSQEKIQQRLTNLIDDNQSSEVKRQVFQEISNNQNSTSSDRMNSQLERFDMPRQIDDSGLEKYYHIIGNSRPITERELPKIKSGHYSKQTDENNSNVSHVSMFDDDKDKIIRQSLHQDQDELNVIQSQSRSQGSVTSNHRTSQDEEDSASMFVDDDVSEDDQNDHTQSLTPTHRDCETGTTQNSRVSPSNLTTPMTLEQNSNFLFSTQVINQTNNVDDDPNQTVILFDQQQNAYLRSRPAEMQDNSHCLPQSLHQNTHSNQTATFAPNSTAATSGNMMSHHQILSGNTNQLITSIYQEETQYQEDDTSGTPEELECNVQPYQDVGTRNSSTTQMLNTHRSNRSSHQAKTSLGPHGTSYGISYGTSNPGTEFKRESAPQSAKSSARSHFRNETTKIPKPILQQKKNKAHKESTFSNIPRRSKQMRSSQAQNYNPKTKAPTQIKTQRSLNQLNNGLTARQTTTQATSNRTMLTKSSSRVGACNTQSMSTFRTSRQLNSSVGKKKDLKPHPKSRQPQIPQASARVQQQNTSHFAGPENPMMSTQNFNAFAQDTGESNLLTLGGMGSNIFGSASVIHTLPAGQNGNIPSEPSFLDQQMISNNGDVHDLLKTNSTIQFSVKNVKGPDVMKNIKEMQRSLQSNYSKLNEQLEQTKQSINNQSLNISRQFLQISDSQQDYREEHHVIQEDSIQKLSNNNLVFQQNESCFFSPQATQNIKIIAQGIKSLDNTYSASGVQPFSQDKMNFKNDEKQMNWKNETDNTVEVTCERSIERPRMISARQLSQHRSLPRLRHSTMSASTGNMNTANQYHTRNISSRNHYHRPAGTQLSQTHASSSVLLQTNVSYDPMKKSIIQNHMSHKGRVTGLQMQFCDQKIKEKQILTQQIQKFKTEIVQANKMKKNMQNQAQVIYDAQLSIKANYDKKQEKTQEIHRKNVTMKNQIMEASADIDELISLRESLQFEMKEEQKLAKQISQICMKYKKIIAEQRKEKEKLNQEVVHQRRIVKNLDNRRGTLIQDNNKIYENFAKVVDNDRHKQSQISKKSVIRLNKEDNDIINC